MTKRQKRDREDMPACRPLRRLARKDIVQRFEAALEARDGVAGAHCIHELWMRKDRAVNIERQLEQLRRSAPETVPEWLPMRHVEWLPVAYEVGSRFEREGHGRTNLYLVLLHYEDSPRGPYGVYVGMSRYPAAVRLVELSLAFALWAHLRRFKNRSRDSCRAAQGGDPGGGQFPTARAGGADGTSAAPAGSDACASGALEEQLAEALRAEGLLVRGGR